jgi:hypothetical protein
MKILHILALSIVFVACSSPPEGAATDQTTDALRTLGANEIVGDIAYGQTSAAIAYTDTPLYRALRFQGKAGDRVDAWVKSPSGGHPRAWLVDAQFLNVVSSGDAASTSAQLLTTLTTTGTYYVAFREWTQEDGTFVVSLANDANGGGGGACDPEVENCPVQPAGDVFDPASCSGPSLTQAAALPRFAAAATTATLGTFDTFVRTRACNNVTGCAAWSPSATVKPQIHEYSSWYNRYYGNQHQDSYSDDVTTGTMVLSTAGNVIDFGLRAPLGNWTRLFNCGSLPSASCVASIDFGASGYVGDGNVYYPDVNLLGVDYGAKLSEVTLTQSCFRAHVSVSTPAAGDGSYTQADLVYFGKF